MQPKGPGALPPMVTWKGPSSAIGDFRFPPGSFCAAALCCDLFHCEDGVCIQSGSSCLWTIDQHYYCCVSIVVLREHLVINR